MYSVDVLAGFEECDAEMVQRGYLKRKALACMQVCTL